MKAYKKSWPSLRGTGDVYAWASEWVFCFYAKL